MWKWVLSLALLILLVTGVWQIYWQPPAISSSYELLKPVMAPDLKAVFAQNPFTLLNLWASRCEACKAEFPALLELRTEIAPKGVAVVFLSADNKSEWPDAAAFLKAQKVDFLTFVAADSATSLVASLAPQWQGAVPSSFVFNQKGELIDSWQGERNIEEFREKIAPMVQK